MSATIQLRRGAASAWTSANPVLALGEPGVETDTLKWKVGDGTTAWNGLAYFNLSSSGGGGTTVYCGVAALSSGVATVSALWINPQSVIVVTPTTAPGVSGTSLYVDPSDYISGTSFVISSTDVTDTRSVFWMAVKNVELFVSWRVSFDATELASDTDADMLDLFTAAGSPDGAFVVGIYPDFTLGQWTFGSNDGTTNVTEAFVAGTTYDIGFTLRIIDGAGTLTPRVSGVDYAPLNIDTAPVTSILSLSFGGRYPGGSGTPATFRNLDNLQVGTMGWGSTDIFSADFTSAIVPPFDSQTGTGISVSSGTMLINNAGMAAYASKDITFP